MTGGTESSNPSVAGSQDSFGIHGELPDHAGAAQRRPNGVSHNDKPGAVVADRGQVVGVGVGAIDAQVAGIDAGFGTVGVLGGQFEQPVPKLVQPPGRGVAVGNDAGDARVVVGGLWIVKREEITITIEADVVLERDYIVGGPGPHEQILTAEPVDGRGVDRGTTGEIDCQGAAVGRKSAGGIPIDAAIHRSDGPGEGPAGFQGGGIIVAGFVEVKARIGGQADAVHGAQYPERYIGYTGVGIGPGKPQRAGSHFVQVACGCIAVGDLPGHPGKIVRGIGVVIHVDVAVGV